MKPQTREEWADYWAVRLDGASLAEADRLALEAWLNADPTNRAALSASCQFLTDLEQQLPVIVTRHSNGIEANAPILPPARRLRPLFWITGLGTTIAAVIVFAAVWLSQSSHDPKFQIAAPAAHIQSIALVDGTRADLNTGTEIKVDFADKRKRTVKMDRGEAMFTVAKNASRPFIVDTPGGHIRVTGTTFNVRVDSTDHMEVTVIEGSVEVIPRHPSPAASIPLRLEIGDQVVVEAERLAVKRFPPGTAIDVAAWRENRVVFDGIPLKDALRRFRVYRVQDFQLSPEAAALRVGGRFNLDDMEGFLRGIENAFAIHINRTPDGKTSISNKHCPPEVISNP